VGYALGAMPALALKKIEEKNAEDEEK